MISLGDIMISLIVAVYDMPLSVTSTLSITLQHQASLSTAMLGITNKY